MQLDFCPHCKKVMTGDHECPNRPDGEAAGEPVKVNLNRHQRRAAIARAKNRIRKEKGR